MIHNKIKYNIDKLCKYNKIKTIYNIIRLKNVKIVNYES